jgi:hypothetical protein
MEVGEHAFVIAWKHIGGLNMAIRKDSLCPYQVKWANGTVWLQNMETGEKFLEDKDDPEFRTALRNKRNEMNSRVGLDRLGI